MIRRLRAGVRARSPEALVKTVRAGREAWRLATAEARAWPDFLILGVQKAGTTSLFRYLGRHPDFLLPWRKEIHFFDRHYDLGPRWYRARFPLKVRLRLGGRAGPPRCTGEATPNYIFHPPAPGRVKRLLPDARFIVLLRDPAERTVSHYHHMVRVGHETHPIEEALQMEPDRLRGEAERMLNDPAYFSYDYLHFSYVKRSLYLEQLKAWMALFPRDRFLILQSETFFSETARVFGQVLRFLGLAPWSPPQFHVYNRFPKSEVDARVVERLRKFFEPYNRRLYDYLGVEWRWPEAGEPVEDADKEQA